MGKLCNAKCRELQAAMASLGARLDSGDQSSLLVEVIPGKLMCGHRPLRRHHNPDFRGPGLRLPSAAAPAVQGWISKVCAYGIRSIICLMGPKEIAHYVAVCTELGVSTLIELYEKNGLTVRSIPWEDPLYRAGQGGISYEEQLLDVRGRALQAFDELAAPVLLHCSSGIQRSAPVAAFIYSLRST